ncbi:uncharacterized protein LOC111070149 [Drosophila obscura]|uniref:uncharacterized protein LOC111070149 n=1 Tax=Drosophila obscura TaxID=7282 RepID=UPI001BB260A7|nr:uncharacterized protein LOC111070149 [Drosophila obscura]
MMLIGLLPVLCWTSVTANQAAMPIPQFMVGDVPAKGQPYQIVRIIEYLVPHPYKPPAGSSKNRAGADSLEIIAPHLESQMNRQHVTNEAHHGERTIFNESDNESFATAKPAVSSNFIVKIYPMLGVVCTGALISHRLVLTAAQCFPANHSPMPEHYMVQVTKFGMYEVELILVGPSSQLDPHMALMVLRTSIVEIEAKPVALCDAPPRRGDSVIMYMSQQLPRFLRTQIVPKRVCRNTFANLDAAYITEKMLCAHNTNKREDCQTTKGDPLVHRERLCGINIHGPRCLDGAINGDLYANVFKAKQHLLTMIERYS